MKTLSHACWWAYLSPVDGPLYLSGVKQTPSCSYVQQISLRCWLQPAELSSLPQRTSSIRTKSDIRRLIRTGTLGVLTHPWCDWTFNLTWDFWRCQQQRSEICCILENLKLPDPNKSKGKLQPGCLLGGQSLGNRGCKKLHNICRRDMCFPGGENHHVEWWNAEM